MTIAQALREHKDAPVLLASVLKKDKAFLFANPEKQLTDLQSTVYELLLQKRRRGIPAAYLLGHKEFFGLDFLINKNVLIPRPETETLVELALKNLQLTTYNFHTVLDVGTGSGNIIISLAKTLAIKSPSPLARGDAPKGQRGRIKFYAIDFSSKALNVARRNARRHGVAHKITFLRGSLFSPMLRGRLRGGRFLIVANLPYGWREWKNNTSAETIGLKYEPQRALFTKEGGLYLIRKLFEQVSSLPLVGRVREGVTLLLEHDPRQKSALQSLARKHFPHARISFHRDLSGHFRVCEIR